MSDKKYASIIFDDGPREPMKEMIDKFANFGWCCGFAIIGNKINDQTESVLKYAIQNDCELCSHSQNHIALAKLSKQEAQEELLQPIREIKNRLNYTIKTARTPFLQNNDMLTEISVENNLPYLGQGIPGAYDWESDINPQEIADSVINNVYDGAVITFHVTYATSKALDLMFPVLKEMNFELVSPSKLFEIKNVKDVPLGKNINAV